MTVCVTELKIDCVLKFKQVYRGFILIGKSENEHVLFNKYNEKRLVFVFGCCFVVVRRCSAVVRLVE